MSGKVSKYDCYDLRKFNIKEIKTFLDIGCEKGTVSVMARILFPFARIVGIEPCIDSYNLLKQVLKYKNIKLYNIALGDGTPLYFKRGRFSGVHRFLTKEEGKVLNQKLDYRVKTKSLSNIFKAFKINAEESFILKVDCEGGERYILKDKESIDYIRKSTQTIMELHQPFGGNYEEWNEFFYKLKDTHQLLVGSWKVEKGVLKYIYTPIEKMTRNACYQIELLRKRR